MNTLQLPLDLPEVCCDYCKQKAELLLDSSKIYNGRDFGPVWVCWPCQAWVGVHKNSPRYLPLGRLANKELRDWKQKAHAMFDPLWQRKMLKLKKEKGVKRRARGDGYHWLAQQLGIPFEECHIGMFDIEMCQKVVELCAPYHPNLSRPAGKVQEDVRVKPEPKKELTTNLGEYFAC